MIVDCGETVGLSNLFFYGYHLLNRLDGSHVDEPGISRYLVMTATDGEKSFKNSQVVSPS